MIYYNEKISTLKGATEQKEMINKIEELKHFTLLEEKRYQKWKYTKCYKESKDKNTKKINFCRTKKYFKKYIKAVL